METKIWLPNPLRDIWHSDIEFGMHSLQSICLINDLLITTVTYTEGRIKYVEVFLCGVEY